MASGPSHVFTIFQAAATQKKSYDKLTAGPDIITKMCLDFSWANHNSPFMIQGISYMIILAEQQNKDV